MAMKALDSSTAFSPIANFELNGEPMQKRRRLSSSSSQQPVYAQQTTFQSTYSAYEPSVKLPTQIPESYDTLKYPFIDHCYFKMEGMVLQEGPVAGPSSVYQRQDSHGLQSDDSGDVPSAMMRGVYKPTAWGVGGNMTSIGDDVDVGGGFDEPGSASEYRAFPSTSFAPPPPPSRQRSNETPRRKRGRKVSGNPRKPYGTGKFVPLAPTHEYASGIQDANIMTNSDTVPLDQYGMDGDVAVQHEVGESDVSFSMGEEILGGPGDDLMQAPAAEELLDAIPQDNLLKDLISQLEHRMQQSTTTSSSTVPQSPTMSAIMRTLMQSPPGTKISGRRLSLSSSTPGSTPQHQSLFDSVPDSGSSLDGMQPPSNADMPIPQITTSLSASTQNMEPQNEDAMVAVVTNQPTVATDSIATILPSISAATTPTSAGNTSDYDESTLNEVYQLLGSKFDNLEDLQKQVGLAVTSPSPKSNQPPTVTSPEVIYTAKTTPGNSLAFNTPGPGSTSRYRTMAKNVTAVASSTATQSNAKVIYHHGNKTIRRVIQTPHSQNVRLIQHPSGTLSHLQQPKPVSSVTVSKLQRPKIDPQQSETELLSPKSQLQKARAVQQQGEVKSQFQQQPNKSELQSQQSIIIQSQSETELQSSQKISHQTVESEMQSPNLQSQQPKVIPIQRETESPSVDKKLVINETTASSVVSSTQAISKNASQDLVMTITNISESVNTVASSNPSLSTTITTSVLNPTASTTSSTVTINAAENLTSFNVSTAAASSTAATNVSRVPATSTATSSSGRIPVRIQLAGGTGSTSGPMRIRLPSGTNLGQSVTKISLQQLLKSGANIQSVSGASTGTRIIRVPAGSLSNAGLSYINAASAGGSSTNPRISTTPVSSTNQNVKIAGKSTYTVTQGSTKGRVVQVARGGSYAHIQGASITKTVQPQDTNTAVASLMQDTGMDSSEPAFSEQETVRDELMDALPTDEEIAQNIQAEGMDMQ